jgi:hypothetical protein
MVIWYVFYPVFVLGATPVLGFFSLFWFVILCLVGYEPSSLWTLLKEKSMCETRIYLQTKFILAYTFL